MSKNTKAAFCKINILFAFTLLICTSKFINAQIDCDIYQSGSPGCPIMDTICPGEKARLHLGSIGAPPVAPDSYNTFSYSFNPNPTSCYDCVAINVSPLETTTYTGSYSGNDYSGYQSGNGMFMVVVEDCGISTDAGLNAFITPTDPLTEGIIDVTVAIENFDEGTLFDAQIQWSVNDIMQNEYTFDDDPIAIASSNYSRPVSLVLGQYNFEQSTSYEIKAWIAKVNGETDLNPSNDTISIYYDQVSDQLDLSLTKFNTPQNPVVSGNSPIDINARNKGNSIIRAFEVIWSVNGLAQPPYVASNLNLQKDEEVDFVIGNYNFDEDSNYEILVEAIILMAEKMKLKSTTISYLIIM